MVIWPHRTSSDSSSQEDVSSDVPDFEVDRYADRLLALHRHIQAEGSFETTIHQFLLVARR